MKQFLLFLCIIFLVGCSAQQQAQSTALSKAQARSAYIPQNEIEFKNYDGRQRIADDPTTIMWCTSAFPIPNSPLFTVPIIGKTTSGNKRPFDTDPGPDGMYGSSNPYDYGFTPVHTLAEWRDMPQFCTNEPLVWQRQATTITMASDPELLAAQNKARAALKAGDKDGAMKILEEAIKGK